MKKLPWNERVAALAINPHMAKVGDVAMLATDLMACRQTVTMLREYKAMAVKREQALRIHLNANRKKS